MTVQVLVRSKGDRKFTFRTIDPHAGYQVAQKPPPPAPTSRPKPEPEGAHPFKGQSSIRGGGGFRGAKHCQFVGNIRIK